MAVRDYREMYITTIMSLGKERGIAEKKLTRSYLADLTFDELRKLALELQG